jgi:hypothetical protein
MVETDWEEYISTKRKELLAAPDATGPKNRTLGVANHSASPLVTYNGESTFMCSVYPCIHFEIIVYQVFTIFPIC